jgi:hypothetical protein
MGILFTFTGQSGMMADIYCSCNMRKQLHPYKTGNFIAMDIGIFMFVSSS